MRPLRTNAALFCVLLVLGCPGEPSPTETTTPPPPASGAGNEGPTVSRAPAHPADRLLSPPPLAPEALATHRERVAEQAASMSIADEPAVDARGGTIVPEDSELRRMPYAKVQQLLFNTEPDPGATGERVRTYNRLFRTEPSARLERDGTVRIRYETTRASPSASVYFGTVIPEDPFALARHRKGSTRHDPSEDATVHELTFDMRRLMRPKYDVAAIRERGRGRIVWRVEALDPKEGSSRLFDGSTGFRCASVPCTADTELVQLPSIRLGPFVDRVRPDAAVVSWETDAATAGFVIAKGEDGDTRTFQGKATGTRHEIALDGLEPGSRYRYYAMAVDARGEVAQSEGATFRTAPAPDNGETAFSFVALSDSRSGHGPGEARYAGSNRDVVRRLMQGAMAEQPGFIVFAGDLVDGYTTEPGALRFELESWQRATQPIGAHVPIYETMGNHESCLQLWSPGWAIDRRGDESAEAIFAERFVNPQNAPSPAREAAPPYRETVYSFGWANAHMAVVNSNYWYRSHPDRDDHPRADKGAREGWVDDRTLEWLDRDLAGARERGAQHLFVFTHEPGFPNGGHTADGMWWGGENPEVLEQRARFFRILARHGVAVLFHGDEHNYSRMRIGSELIEGMERPVWQIISGGAGAPFYARNTDVPWADRVDAFDARQHFVAFHIDGPRLTVETVSITGETIDRFTAGGSGSGARAKARTPAPK